MTGICRMKHPHIPEEHRMNQSFTVTGMSCGHCEKAVTQAIRQLDPQAEVRIDRSHNLVEVQSQQPRDALSRAIAEEGYAVAA
jgi:copper chaperone